ncbi:MAG: class I SAM-dependent methyltransferase [Candidatus Aminicenantes bacterium]|nr:class I SAM-dependent methyltransferase [Candidatus Aminicenantes bacterium]
MREPRTVAAAIGPKDVAACDTFDFMANVIGLPILHPGGLRANDEMIRLCKVARGADVLDVACGRGTNALYFAEKCGCAVTGVDLDDRLLREAQAAAKKRGLEGMTRFESADAERLPYVTNRFDTVLSQAVLIMVADRDKALREAARVVRPGGLVGILELTWKRQPHPEFFREAEPICAYFSNVLTFDGWRRMIFQDGLTEVDSRLHDMACPCTPRELGLRRALGIFFKQLFNPKIRERMREIDRFVAGHDDYFGYGIYVGRKAA